MSFLIFYLSLIFSFLPGYFLRVFLFKNSNFNQTLSSLEKFVIDFSLGLFFINFLFILMDFLNIAINRKNLILSIIFSCIVLVVFKSLVKAKNNQEIDQKKDNLKTFNTLKDLSYRDVLIITLIIFFAVTIRIMYISRGIMPQTTDMGHHMYWVNYIAINQKLPNYERPDFIIGEHTPLSSVMVLSKLPVIHFFPTLVLYVINIFSLIATFILAFKIFYQYQPKDKFAKKSSILALLIIGLFYSISSPQAKFISGGVIGNIMGNLFIPMLFYSFIMSVLKKSSSMASVFFLLLFGIIYTHHLSSYIFLFSFAGFFISLFLFFLIKTSFNLKKFLSLVKENSIHFFSTKNLFILLIFAIFIFFIRTPSYLNTSAIETAIGTPEKSTRTGYSLSGMASSIGAWNFLYGMLGLIIIIWKIVSSFFKKETFSKKASSLMISFWFITIFVMSYAPQLLKVDIPSRRVLSYLSYPTTILAGLSVYWLLEKSRQKFTSPVFFSIFCFIFFTGFIAGLGNISESARSHDSDREKEVYQTFLASQYTSEIASENQNVLKDHIQLAADSWIKLFFMRNYDYPLSRTFLNKYNDPFKPRETCTRDMISDPDSERAQDCYNQTATTFIILKKNYDTAQFEKSNNFSKIFVSNTVVVFKRENF